MQLSESEKIFRKNNLESRRLERKLTQTQTQTQLFRKEVATVENGKSGSPISNLKPVMTTAEVSKAIGLSEYDIRKLEKEGVLKRLRGTRCPIKFSGEQIYKWLKGDA
ncbi:type IV toxin-antitoxin system AbiEi family antitoxin domain-containing protein [Kiritimatiellaeota bacterium B1221]|nr:type IV toxin-antitoxin system AbiEi family antitoxin domain-containing protein [Kiritimatiellaeota bacterium B1221]